MVKRQAQMDLVTNFIKKCHELISPRLQALYIHAFKEQTSPQTLTKSTITLIPKKDKDLDEPGSYRAIALLNMD